MTYLEHRETQDTCEWVDSDGLWRCEAETYQDFVLAWKTARREMNHHQYRLGAIAAKFTRIYGDQSIAKLASDVNEKPGTIYLYARTFRECGEFFDRLKNLTFTHFSIIAEAGLDPGDRELALNAAADKQWSTGKLRKQIRASRAERTNPELARDPQFRDAAVEWAELRPRVERFGVKFPQHSLAVVDFIADVDEAISDPWDSARAHLERLIERGNQDVEGLSAATRCDRATVQQMLDELVSTGAFEWVVQGGKTDEARGARKTLIHPKGSPTGDRYEVRRSPVYEDDGW